MTISAGSPAVASDFTTSDAGSSNSGKVELLDANGRHRRSMAFSQTVTYGETISALDVLYLKRSDGKFYKADADNTEDQQNQFAIAYESGVNADTKRIYSPGEIVTGLSFGSETAVISEATDQSQTTSTAAAIEQIYSTRVCRQTFTTGDTTGNISAIDLYLTKVGGGGTGLTVDVYAIDDSGVKSGSTLGTKAIVTASLTSGAYNKFTFASAITVSPRTHYMIEVTATGAAGDASNYWAVNGSSSTSYDRGGAADNTMAGSNRILKDTDFAFRTYTTLTRNYYLGDKVYLSNTAGGISINEGTNPRVIGILLSSTTMLFLPGFAPVGELLASFGFSCAQANAASYKFGVPRNCSRIVVISTNGASGARGECVVFKKGKTVGYFGDSSNDLTATWSGNEFNIQENLNGGSTRTIKCYAYSA